jgi:hypothetical protein
LSSPGLNLLGCLPWANVDQERIRLRRSSICGGGWVSSTATSGARLAMGPAPALSFRIGVSAPMNVTALDRRDAPIDGAGFAFKWAGFVI